MKEAVLERIGSFRRRYLRVRAADRFLELWFVLTVAAASLLLLDRLSFEFGLSTAHLGSPLAVVLTFAGATGLAGILALVALGRRVEDTAVAWRLDKALGGEERLLTSVELASNGTETEFAPALLTQAAESMARADERKVFPSAPVGYRAGVALALVAGALLVAWPPAIAPAPIADFTSDVRRGAAPLDVVFADATIGVVETLEWEFSDGTLARGRVSAHRFETPGRYSVTLTARGPGGADVETKKNFIEVLDARLPVAEFDGQPLKGRAPLAVSFENRSKNAATFEWDFGDGSRSTEERPGHLYPNPGVYTVTLTASNSFGRDTVARRNLVKVIGPDAPIAEFRANPVKGKAQLPVQFEDLSEKASEWEWDFGDPLIASENSSRERNPNHLYRFPGKYTVKLRVKGPGGEDEAVKEKYIEVESDGDGGAGGGGGGGKDPAAGGGGGKDDPGAAGKDPGKNPFGDKSKRPKAEFDPVAVPVDPKGPLFEKDKPVVSKTDGSGGTETAPYAPTYENYRRAAEDAMEREQIPPSMREYVKKYYERVRPK
jgi:PKD repeat protein